MLDWLWLVAPAELDVDLSAKARSAKKANLLAFFLEGIALPATFP
jgi:hypothetical protein